MLNDLPRLNVWVFTYTRERPIGYDTVRKAFARIFSAAGLDDVSLHDLRRTAMTMADRYARAVGKPVEDAREDLGATIAEMMDGGADEDEQVPPEA